MIILKYIYYRFYSLTRKFKATEWGARLVASNLSNLPIAFLFLGMGFLLFDKAGMLMASILYVIIHMRLYNVYPLDMSKQVVVYEVQPIALRRLLDVLIVVYFCFSIVFLFYTFEHNQMYGSLINPKKLVEVEENFVQNEQVSQETNQEPTFPIELNKEKSVDENIKECAKIIEELQQQNNTNSSQ